MLQGDTFYDMVERSDVAIVKSHLDTENNSSSGNFKHFGITLCSILNIVSMEIGSLMLLVFLVLCFPK